MSACGLTPEALRQVLRKSEWDHPQHLKQRLLGEREFPLTTSLRPASGKQALSDLVAFHAFLDAWQAWPEQDQLSWKNIQYAQLGQKRVPTHFTLRSMGELIAFLGDDALSRSQQWQQRMIPLLAIKQDLYPTLVRQLKKLEQLSQIDIEMLAQLLPQLSQGMGQGGYLRALPVIGVDTKFIETHQVFISQLLDVLHSDAISQYGGLLAWLGCQCTPADWLLVRSLGPDTQARMGGLPILRLPTEALLSTPLPAQHILVVENDQSGYGLPNLSDTIAVIGGGRNLAWMDAPWLSQKKIGYWGDLDTWGFLLLSEARQRQAQLESLLMDRDTLLHHRERMVNEPEPYSGQPQYLTEQETRLYQEIRDGVHGNTRLEQERLSVDYVVESLVKWLG